MNAKFGKLKKTIWKSYGITFLVSEVLFLVGAFTRETWEPGSMLAYFCLAVQFIGLLAVLVIILSLSIAEHIARRKAPAKRSPNRPAVRHQEPRPPKVTEETRAKWEKENREAREALRADISAQLVNDPDAEEILKTLEINPNNASHCVGTYIWQESDGTWTLTGYRDCQARTSKETNLSREEAISKLVAFARKWPAGTYPPDSWAAKAANFKAMVEKNKDDAYGMGKVLLDWYGGLHIPEGAVPDHLYVYEQMAGIHDESETCIEIRDANKTTLADWTIREPTDYTVSGEKRCEDELIVAYLAETLDISVENAGHVY